MAFRHPSPAGRNKKASPGASAPPWAQPQRGTPTSQGGGSLDEDDEIADDASYLDPGDLEVSSHPKLAVVSSVLWCQSGSFGSTDNL